jgi:NAD(P)-dependent dehydrogenase (short-subunit alcohol dehydrogenase family)
MAHPVFSPGRTAVITGGASGIGLAAAKQFAALGLKICLADLAGEALDAAADTIAEIAPNGASDVLAVPTDVGRRESVQALEQAALNAFGPAHVLMNNAGIQPGSRMFGPAENWARILQVNLGGVIHGSQVFVPGMMAHGEPGLVINTGSKAGVKAFTEALQHELRTARDGRISAHLLIPGFVFTGLTARGRTEKPAGAWTPEQTIAFMMERLEAGDFYILCPDNEVTRALDEKRILWAAGDIVENRPPLSRWHPDYEERFRAFLKDA